MRTGLACITVCLMAPALLPQAAGQKDPLRELLFTQQNYAVAAAYYEQLLKAEPGNPELNQKLGICYLHSRSSKRKAIPCFELVIASAMADSTQKRSACRMLADVCYATGLYSSAITYYQAYRKFRPGPGENDRMIAAETDHLLRICRAEQEVQNLKKVLRIITKEAVVNGTPLQGYEYASSKIDSQSVCITYRKTRVDSAWPNLENFDASLLPPMQPDSVAGPESIDTAGVIKEATVATSFDGQILLTYRNDKGEPNLYIASLHGNEWSYPAKLIKPINAYGWEKDQWISADGRSMYFTSSWPGGYGGKDIYHCTKLENGEWGPARNLGWPVNTPYDEEAPFIHPDGITLYFSSTRYNTKGGYDLFKTVHANNSWTRPAVVGYPIDPAKYKKVYSPEEMKDMNLGKQNYVVTFQNQGKTPLTLIKTKVVDVKQQVVLSARVLVLDNEKNDTLGIYYPDPQSGQFSVVLPAGKNNHLAFEAPGYLYHSEHVDTGRDTSSYRLVPTVEMSPIAENSSEELNNVFFNPSDNSILRESSSIALSKLFDLLKNNPGVSLEMSSTCTDGKKNSPEEEKLNVRLKALQDYLSQQGINKERLETRINRNKKKRRNESAKTREAPIEIKIVDLKNT